MKYYSRIFKVFLFLFIGWILTSFLGSVYSTWPKQMDIPAGKTYFSQAVEEIILETNDHVKISTWYLHSKENKKAVILLNGIGANRKGLVTRAKLYINQGFSVLMPDLRGTGESEGAMISFGWHEQKDLQKCFEFLKQKNYQTIGVHGLSLGAATIAYSFQHQANYDFVILESCYDNIDNALKNRINKYHIPFFLTFSLQWITQKRIGVTTKQLRPEDYMQFNHSPTLIMAGGSELRVKKEETQKIFDQIAAKEKQLHFFEAARHENFMNRFEKEYRQVLNDWLSMHQLSN